MNPLDKCATICLAVDIATGSIKKYKLSELQLGSVYRHTVEPVFLYGFETVFESLKLITER